MLPFLIRRIGRALFTLWLAVTLAFFALHALPSDAISLQLAGSGASPAQINAQRALFGLDQPLSTQYLSMLSGLLRGDLGRSLGGGGRPVAMILGEQIGSTLQLAIAALIVAVLIGLLLGLIAALARPAPIRGVAAELIAVTLAAPVYWTGTLAIYLFAVGLHWLPSAGSGDLRHLILPAFTLGFAASGAIAQLTATTVRSARAASFVRTARAKGLRARTITADHVLRPALPPIIALIAVQAGFLLGGTAITEALFVRPGIGQVVLNAIASHDYPVVQGAVVLSAITYTILNTAADLVNARIDPRLGQRMR